MAYNIFHPDKYFSELKHRQSLDIKEKPIIDKYYAELRAKQKPTLEELSPSPNEQQIRSVITNELSLILRNSQQVAYVIEELSKSNDLMSFYKFGKLFLNSIKEVRGIDGSFLLQLWNKFKTKMLIASESEGLPKTGLTATEYMEALKHNRKVASSEDLEHPQIVIHPGAKVMAAPDTSLRQIVVHSNYHHPLSSIQKSIAGARNLRFKKSLYPLETDLEQYPNKGNLSKSYDVEHLTHTNPYGYRKGRGKNAPEYTKIPRKSLAYNSILAKESTYFPVGRPPKLSQKNLSKLQSYEDTKKSTSTTATTAPTTSSIGHGIKGSGIIGYTYLTRR